MINLLEEQASDQKMPLGINFIQTIKDDLFAGVEDHTSRNNKDDLFAGVEDNNDITGIESDENNVDYTTIDDELYEPSSFLTPNKKK